MPTHFRTGVSNQVPGNPLFEFPYLDPTKYVTYFNDFFTYHAGEWTITTTEAGTGSATEALASGSGGLLLITNAAGDNDLDFLQLKGEAFKYVATKNMFLKQDLKLVTLPNLILLWALVLLIPLRSIQQMEPFS